MKAMTEEKKELKYFGFPLKILKRLYSLIELDNYKEHIKAKQYFVKEGENILPVMHKLLKSHSRIIRKESIKVVELIAHKSSIPIAIDMLRDRETDIRWIAAETLIRIGRDSINPLLEALVANGTSYYLRQGAHHVLAELVNEKDPKELKQLVHVLRHGNEVPERIPVKAAHVLDKGPSYN